MADIDLTVLTQNDVVLHFGGRPNEVDAFTFSNALIAFSEAIQEINSQLDTKNNVSISIEGLGEGSFRAKVAPRFKSVGGIFTRASRDFLINIFASFVFATATDKPSSITVDGDKIIVSNGNDRIIMKKDVWDARLAIKNPKAVTKHISQAFEVMEEDHCVTEFGLAPSMHSKHTIGVIDRSRFGHIAKNSDTHSENKIFVEELAHLTVLKVIFEASSRKWQFVWNGIKISAPVKDEAFLAKVASGNISFRHGDDMSVTLRINKVKDTSSGAYLNESYEVIRVHGHSKGPHQHRLFD